MKFKILTACCFFFVGCNLTGTHQEINIANKCSENIFYTLKPDSILTAKDIGSIRPMTDKEIQTHFLRGQIHFEDPDDSLAAIENMKSNYLIKTESVKTILASRGVSIFPDRESIKSQIQRDYHGQVFVFTIPEKTLEANTDDAIIKKKYVKFYTSLSARNLTSDTLNLVYE